MNQHLRRWASRLSFSFLIVAAACGWEAYRSWQRQQAMSRVVLLSSIAVILFVLFVTAMKIRHSSHDWHEL